jgi:gas vesicle protein
MDPIILIIGAVVVAVGAVIFANRRKGIDVNQDSRVDVKDLTQAVSNTVDTVKQAMDVNKDGKLDSEDAKAVVNKAKATAKRTVAKVRTPNQRKSTTKKPAK